MMVYQATSFYNALIALEQIDQKCDQPMRYYLPMLVYGAFSIEVTLKTILAKNKIKYGKEHNLYILFYKLPNSFQRELRDNLIEKNQNIVILRSLRKN